MGLKAPAASHPSAVTPAAGEDRGSVWFASEGSPGVRVVLTVLLDGTVTGFEVHAAGTERASPYPELESSPPADEVSIGTRLVRSVPVGDLAVIARAALRKEVEMWAQGSTSWVGDQAAVQARALHGDAKRPGRRGRPARYFAALAVAYEQWQESGDRLAVLAEQLELTESALRAALNTARTKGFLTPAPPGRAGGVATGKAKQLLGEAH